MTSRFSSFFGSQRTFRIAGRQRQEEVNLHSSAFDGLEEREPFIVDREHVEQEHFTPWITRKLLRTWSDIREFIISEQGAGIFKCSLAYLLASLAVFIPMIGNLLGHQNGKHLVATITVYFHPARTQGSMYKALICAFVAFIFAAILSLSSMWVTILFQRKHDMIELGHAVVLVVFVAGGFGFIGWTKQRMSDPLVNVACSLASLASTIVITREGAVQSGALSFDKISQVLRMVLLGVGIAAAVSLSILPLSARKQFRGNLSTLTDTVTLMLVNITDSFLRGSDYELQKAEFINLSARHDKAFGQMKNTMEETKFEHYVAGTGLEYHLEKRLVCFMQDITHSLGGLRSAGALHFELLAPTRCTRPTQMSCPQTDSSVSVTIERPRLVSQPQSVSKTDVERYEAEKLQSAPKIQQDAPLNHPGDDFELIISRLEISMLSLASTLRDIFKEVSFGPAPDYRISINGGARPRIDEAVKTYREVRMSALCSLSHRREIMSFTQESKAGLEEIFASCDYFSVSLLKLSEKLQQFLSVLEELQIEVEGRPNGVSWTWACVSWWRADHQCERHRLNPAPSSSPYHTEVNSTSLTRMSNPTDQLENRLRRQTRYERADSHAWRPFDFFRTDEIKFALKVGIGAALYALPSFISLTRPLYLFWRGEWGLLSYMLVCSMTIGASNTTGYARFLGTCLGALCSIGAWYITGGNAFRLAVVGFVMALGQFYMIIVKGKGPMGRFILLTYNLSVLYAFSYSQIDGNEQDDGGEHLDITEIALHRVISVISGCLWGIIITRGIWPIRARTKLNNTLHLLWFRLVLIWKSDPLNTMATAEASMSVLYMNSHDKNEIERLLSQLESLQVSARSEFELKSPFPDAEYRNIIRQTRGIVDNFHSMNLILVNIPTPSEGQISLLRYTAAVRQQLSERIGHLLTVMASSIALESTSSNVPTNIKDSRDRLLEQISHYRQGRMASRLTNGEDYVLLSSFVLVAQLLSNEISEIMVELGHIFPVSDDEDSVNADRV
ncbi:hypothetical protein N7499_011265 [Penicillium canescens]|uniref:Integral membrane bound transporter domain-containing protein n=1 Tax=Penicillium canescens TaxID=5083 RepID=A0AAD6ILQ5_PENCN|nr:uncharacterized protein N7446_006523 [Penicillium canescens]KAJ6051886.1 hypothetical protein N7460_002420 [Penicillium canescens]KAJ6062403.1 hypothetical protein N7446_006523 [Penicillium canescens]KAJ6065650.1 hypothetical protein N7444_001303 [Penicillium canescens]KAJ6069378.1 hypothetical protein N7499_011265 [Penicillium canescens]KAJ6182569.1 hypothetical protein N7485_001211 [Penicillium canescens]